MDSGIIVCCHNNGKELDLSKICDFLKCTKNTHICFINNGSTDNTKEILKELVVKYPEHISFINIKNKKALDTALRTGFRYLINKQKINQINFSYNINFDDLNNLNLI